MDYKNLIIVTPVYNDWKSFKILVQELYKLFPLESIKISCVIAVNDGSIDNLDETQLKSVIPITVLNLNTNMGHQRAISIGLSYLNNHDMPYDAVVVMDCDGEDRPVDINKLRQVAAQSSTETIVFAKREKRSEGFVFKLFYKLYKAIFYMLTSQKIDFGNFSFIPKGLIPKVVSIPDIWNHYSGGVIKSKIPYSSIGTDRGRRYQGSSKMNFQNLVLHGLSSISIYLDVVSVRLLLGSIFCALLVGFGIIVMVVLAFLDVLLITNILSAIGLILINVFSIVVLITFLILLFQLNQKSNVKLPPRTFYKDFILSVVSLYPKA